MTHPLEDENRRRLRAALEGLLIEVDGPPPYDTQGRVAAARAALAAEPASGKMVKGPTHSARIPGVPQYLKLRGDI